MDASTTMRWAEVSRRQEREDIEREAIRQALEQTQGAEILKTAADKTAAEATEQAVLAAWRKWYGEALESARRLPARGSTPALDARVQQAQQRLTQAR